MSCYFRSSSWQDALSNKYMLTTYSFSFSLYDIMEQIKVMKTIQVASCIDVHIDKTTPYNRHHEMLWHLESKDDHADGVEKSKVRSGLEERIESIGSRSFGSELTYSVSFNVGPEPHS